MTEINEKSKGLWAGTLILASASPRRLQLLEQLGMRPQVKPSRVEEHMTGEETPAELVMSLSGQKALDVASREPEGSLVLGADTVVAVDGRVLGKPASEEEAVQMLRMIQGRTHQVYTGVTIVRAGTGKARTFAEETQVEVYPMDDQEILSYVETKDPMDKAGAYGIQGVFAAHVRGIRGDYNNVVGLPIGRVYQELKAWEREERHD